MLKSPEAYRTIFTRWWWMDLFFYGFLIGGLGITAFAVPVYASPLNGGKGLVYSSCNDVGYDSAICENVYHGRATCFSTVMITLMIHSFEVGPSPLTPPPARSGPPTDGSLHPCHSARAPSLASSR